MCHWGFHDYMYPALQPKSLGHSPQGLFDATSREVEKRVGVRANGPVESRCSYSAFENDVQEQWGHSTLISNCPIVKSFCEGAGAKSEGRSIPIPWATRTRLPTVSVIGHLGAQLQTVGNDRLQEFLSKRYVVSTGSGLRCFRWVELGAIHVVYPPIDCQNRSW